MGAAVATESFSEKGFVMSTAAPTLPPGPRLPIIGALVGPGRDPLDLLTRYARDYGDVTFFKLGSDRCYFINHPNYIKDVLVTQQRNFTKSRGLERAKKLLGEGLLTAEGQTHLRHRRLLQPAFHRDRIAAYAQVMIDYAARLNGRWTDGETVDISKEMMRVTLSIAGKTLFDTDVESKADEVGMAVTDVLESFWLNLLPGADFLEKLPIPKLRRAHASRDRLDALIYRMIADRRASGRDHGDLLSMLIAAQEDSEGDASPPPTTRGLTDEEIRDEAMTILLAGHETTANALMWTLYLLSQNADAATKLHAELDRVLAGRLPAPRDYPQLSFAKRVVTESMRLFPPAWIIGRRAIADYAIGDYHLPPRSVIFMSPFVMQRDARFYAEPTRFNPDRWTPEFEAALPKFAYFPFGGGARQCIGEQFAWMEAVLVLATIAQRWRFELDPSQRIVPQPLITLRSRYGMKMRAFHRSRTIDPNGHRAAVRAV
jgi:cytochrome P450